MNESKREFLVVVFPGFLAALGTSIAYFVVCIIWLS